MSSQREHLRLVSESDPQSDSEVGSNERTNERTHAADPNGRQSGQGSEWARVYEEIDQFTTPGAVIEAGELWPTTDRHPRTRIGERDEIPRHVRAAVWFRDGGKCADCHPEHPSGDPLHLDHIKPWSAGGADTTDNLRLLCERHNVERSNYVDFVRPKRRATWWCANCYDLDRHVWEYAGPFVTCPNHGSTLAITKARCRIQRAYGRAFANGEPMPTWHRRPMLTNFEHIAYCAHCDAPGMTGVLL